MRSAEGRTRVAVEGVHPEVDGGEFAVKRIVGDVLTVEANLLVDGHDLVAGEVLYRHLPADIWQSSGMRPIGQGRWRGEFPAEELGEYEYTVRGWIDRFGTWRAEMKKRLAASQDVGVDCLIGAGLVEDAASRADGNDAARLREWASLLRHGRPEIALDDDLAAVVRCYPDRRFAGRYPRILRLVVDRPRAAFASWYEMFPRSCGTLRECESRLPYVASMGFDVLYLPPIHPIGHTYRKGKNNRTEAAEDDAGSPWAIGSEEGGHTSVHPGLGTIAEFDHLMLKARELGIEIALDLAFQCSPDHPWVREHPEWFRHRPDGTIQYAENPPKKYQDIYPLDFETPQWRELWEELKRVVLFWMDRGVEIFRVDNPHTKAFGFWEWLIAEIKRENPRVLFLSEALTRPRIMYRLAKLGFSQSYTYFTWRNTKSELTAYFRELTQTDLREYFRANLWPNTPDILPEFLQTGGRAAFMIRLILAATLAANYGIYGPAFELCEGAARERGSEEYLNSEKYESKRWNLDTPWSLKHLIARVNRIRRENPALQCDGNLRFHETGNPAVICYSKTNDDLSDIVIVVGNLDVFHTQTGWVTLDLAALGLDASRAFQAHDLLSDGRYLWQGPHNYFELVPGSLPAHIMKVRRWLRTEKDFDYYL